jgi:arylsulfatase A-like enzyme
LYEELLRVPIIVRAPGLVRAGLRVRTPVSLLDIAPTLLSLAGIPADPQHRGRNLSLTLRGGEEPAALPIFAESVHYGPDRFSVRQGDLKIIATPFPSGAHSDVRLRVEPLEIFDLEDDPAERTNLRLSAKAPPALLNAVLGRALRFSRKGSVEDSPAHDLVEGLEEQLRALGYLD